MACRASCQSGGEEGRARREDDRRRQIKADGCDSCASLYCRRRSSQCGETVDMFKISITPLLKYVYYYCYYYYYYAPCGAGAPLFPLVHLLPHLFPFLLFPFFPWLYLFSSFVHPFPFCQNSPTPFPGRRS